MRGESNAVPAASGGLKVIAQGTASGTVNLPAPAVLAYGRQEGTQQGFLLVPADGNAMSIDASGTWIMSLSQDGRRLSIMGNTGNGIEYLAIG